jgi:hypothetical protein
VMKCGGELGSGGISAGYVYFQQTRTQTVSR